jgi:tetratricopeptide (TPR) repeat protein
MQRTRLPLSVACALIASTAAAQDLPIQSGRAVYERVANSVFLVQTETDSGEPVGQGTAFLIDDGRLITNEHVIREGRVFLRSAGLKIECAVAARDELNDLALLTVPAVGVSRPLRLAGDLPRPGDAVFAIGNPEGLERTISLGLYTGPRRLDGRDLLQVSASISHGSSGGPVVNASGEVVGVASGFLTEGQNLNFAVPIAAVRALLSGGGSAPPSVDNFLGLVRRLQEERRSTTYSADPGSRFQALDRRISQVLSDALRAADDKPESLLLLAETASLEDGAIALKAAEQAVDLTKGADPRARIAFARALRAKGTWANEPEKERLLRLAEDHAAAAIAALQPPLADHLVLLAAIQEQLPGRLADSYQSYKRALELRKRSQPDDVSLDLFQLFEAAARTSRPAEARSWFLELELTGKATSAHYDSYGKFLESAEDHTGAGEAYVRAAGAAGGTYDHFCRAARSFLNGDNLDGALTAARQCIESAASVADSEKNVAHAHQTISLILVDRGVYDEAISHARQAVAIDPADGWAYYALARALRSLNRYHEAIAAGKNALRLADGRHAVMHAALGSAYFGLQDWSQAASAYRKAAEMDPDDADAAFNAAAALYNEKSFRESLRWWEEVLRRDPEYPDRAYVQQTIQELRGPA